MRPQVFFRHPASVKTPRSARSDQPAHPCSTISPPPAPLPLSNHSRPARGSPQPEPFPTFRLPPGPRARSCSLQFARALRCSHGEARLKPLVSVQSSSAHHPPRAHATHRPNGSPPAPPTHPHLKPTAPPPPFAPPAAHSDPAPSPAAPPSPQPAPSNPSTAADNPTTPPIPAGRHCWRSHRSFPPELAEL